MRPVTVCRAFAKETNFRGSFRGEAGWWGNASPGKGSYWLDRRAVPHGFAGALRVKRAFPPVGAARVRFIRDRAAKTGTRRPTNPPEDGDPRGRQACPAVEPSLLLTGRRTFRPCRPAGGAVLKKTGEARWASRWPGCSTWRTLSSM